MLKFVVFSYLILGTTMAFAQSEGLWRQALGEYTDESLDYIDTLSETRLELKFWRQKVLQERFDGKLSRFEKMLSEGNVDFLKQIETFITKDGRDGLDDS